MTPKEPRKATKEYDSSSFAVRTLNPHLESLLTNIGASSGDEHEAYALQLWMVLERNFGANRTDPLHRDILPGNLYGLSLTVDELPSIIAGVQTLAESETLPLARRARLISLLGVVSHVDALGVALCFLGKNREELDDDSLHSVIVAINPAWLDRRDWPKALAILREYNAERLFEILRHHNKAEVAERARSITSEIDKIRQACG